MKIYRRLRLITPIYAVLLALTAFLLTASTVLACDITITPAQASGPLGNTLTFTIEMRETHRNCIVPIEDTQIILEKMELLTQTPWLEIINGTHQSDITVRLLTEGEGSITVVRECIKGGDTAVVNVLITEAETVTSSPPETKPPVESSQLSTSSLPPSTNPLLETNLTIKAEPTTEPGWGQAFADAISQPYMITYLALTSIATIAFFKRWRRWRFISLMFSMVYLGFFLGLCPCPLGSLQSVIIHSNDVKTYLAHFLLLGIPLTSTLFVGRIYCGWVCPMGAVQQLLYRKDTSVKIPQRLNNILKYVKYLVLAVLVTVVLKTGTIVFNQVDPFKALFNMEVILIPTTILVITLIASLFIFAPWCRYICPLGAFLSLFSRFSLFKLKISDGCKNCKACQKVYCEYKVIREGEQVPVVSSPECTRCGECLVRCPKDSIVYEANPILRKIPVLVEPSPGIETIPGKEPA